MKRGREISAGGVVYKKTTGGLRIALIERKDRGIWGLPKGKIETGEKPDQTALREVLEETGLTARIERKIDHIRYTYYSKKRDMRLFKIVTFFLMKYIKGSIRHHDWEVDDCKWFLLDEALEKMSYLTEREVVKKAARLLKKN